MKQTTWVLISITDLDSDKTLEVPLQYEWDTEQASMIGLDPLRESLDWDFGDSGRWTCDHDRLRLLGMKDDGNVGCSGRFHINWIKTENGEVVYEEPEE